MSQNAKEGFDPMDPIGTWRTIRDANLDAWAKSMASFTNTDAFAQMIGVQLDTLLAASAPLQQSVQQAMEQYLKQAQMPSRSEVVSLADRLTNIEMRLDDMQATLETIHTGIAPPAPAPTPTADLQDSLNEIRAALKELQPPSPPVPADLQAALNEIRAALKELPTAAEPAPQPAPRRTRKSSETV
jgi:paraquat-inducible protein B